MKNFYKKYGYFIFLFFLVLSLFDMRFASIAVLCMFAPIVLAIAGKGRYWCGNFCPRGNFYDNVLSLISPKKKIPKFLKSIGFRVFMIIFILVNFSYGLYKNLGDLYGIGFLFYRIIVITTIVGILFGVFNHYRAWCNFCPMGTLSYLISKVRGRNVNLAVDSNCVKCGICNKACPMGISPEEYKNDSVVNKDCIFCEKCGYKCPKQSIRLITK